jgi:hypothetical protein
MGFKFEGYSRVSLGLEGGFVLRLGSRDEYQGRGKPM